MCVRAGIPLLTALQVLKRQSRGTLEVFADRLMRGVESGQSLAASLGGFKESFGELAVALIGIGEMTGTLDDSLDAVAAELKKKQALRRKVAAAAMYPAVIVAATIGITTLLVAFVVPKILPVFQSLDIELPWSTRSVLFASGLLRRHAIALLAASAALIAGARASLKIDRLRLCRDRLLVAVPLVGRLARDYAVASACRTLGTLLKSGVTIVQAARIAAETAGNLAYKNALRGVAETVAGGEPISSRLERNPRLFPPVVTQMIAAGENTGKLSETLLYLARTYEEEVDALTKNMAALLEPVLMLCMGTTVGFVAMSIITPIYEITGRLGSK